MLPKQQLMSRSEFLQFLADGTAPILVKPPYDYVECTCGDVNCHGWRIVTARKVSDLE